MWWWRDKLKTVEIRACRTTCSLCTYCPSRCSASKSGSLQKAQGVLRVYLSQALGLSRLPVTAALLRSSCCYLICLEKKLLLTTVCRIYYVSPNYYVFGISEKVRSKFIGEKHLLLKVKWKQTIMAIHMR